MSLWVILPYSLLLLHFHNFSALTEDAAICAIASEFLKSYQFVSGWNCIDDSPVTAVCNGESSNWEGIKCIAGNVTDLVLPYYYISGNIPSTIGYLTNLRSLDLSCNYFFGTMPQSLCYLPNLEFLSLYSNQLTGTFPSCIGLLQKLNYLYLYGNYFTGSLPSSIGFLTNMYQIYLQYFWTDAYNTFTGTIPSSIGYLTSLSIIYFNDNAFTGTIPQSISNLTNLQYLALYSNKLTGTIPSCIGLLQKLNYLYLDGNYFTGSLPSSIGFLTNMYQIYLQYFWSNAYNTFTGTIPSSIGYLTSLSIIYFNDNEFTGTIPQSISNLTNLQYLALYSNKLTGTIPSCIGLLTNLYSFSIARNKISGCIPSTFAYLTNLSELFLNFNNINGTVPTFFGLLSSLANSEIGHNNLTGTIPSTIGNLRQLFHIAIDCASLTGTIPSTLGKLTRLLDFIVTYNRLTGTLPTSIGTMSSLSILYVYSNCLTGSIPEEFGLLSNMMYVDFYDNSLTGSIPEGIGNLTDVRVWTMSNNHLTGSIPTTIGYLTKLESLYLASNSLTGSLPSSLGRLTRLTVLDLSVNHLSQGVPTSLQRLSRTQELYLRNNRLSGELTSFVNTTSWKHLNYFDVSNNYISGTLPEGSFLNNNKLFIFAAADNCIDVMIPSDFCLAENLRILALDGLASASKCQLRFFPHTSTVTYTLARQLSRSIPSCLFSMSKLTALHLSGNALTGTLPDTATLAPVLQDLTLSYNRLEGTIPLQIQRRKWKFLDLSYNSFSGTLSRDMSTNNATKYSLKINRLSGMIPSGLREAPSISILQGNIFQCSFIAEELPQNDEDNSSYHCGSDNLYLSLYVFFGLFLLFLLLEQLLEPQRFSLRQIYLFLFHYQGKSDFFLLSLKLCRFSLVLLFFSVFFLMPVYSFLGKFYGTYTFKYGWSVSAGYLVGLVPTITLLVVWTAMLGCFQSFYLWLLKESNQPAKGKPSQVVVVVEFTEAGEEAPPSLPPPLTASVPSIPITPKTEGTEEVLTVQTIWIKVVSSGLILLNTAVIFGANSGYVYATLGLSSGAATIILLQISLGVFKTLWFNLYVYNLSNMVRAITGYNSKQYHKVIFLSLVLIVNNVILPIIAEIAVDSNCIYNILVPPASIGTSYSYPVCVGQEWGVCYDYADIIATVTLVPPFIYRYQCSPILVTNYASVYVYMFLLTAIQIPLSAILVKFRSLFSDNSFGFQLFNSLSHNLHQVPPTFSSSFYLAGFISNIAILLTFGLVYPPLAVIISLSVISDMYFTLQQIDQLQLEIIHEVIGVEVFSILQYLLPFSALFLAFFLYDISKVVWAPVVLAGMSIAIYFLTFFMGWISKKKSTQNKVTALRIKAYEFYSNDL